MHVERLIRLADKLTGDGAYKCVGPVPEDQFDLGQWIGRAPCGTAACAVGWAMTDKWFNRQGLRANKDPVDPPYPRHGKNSSWDAVLSFFEIDFQHAIWLFDSCSYEHGSAPNVAARIRKSVANYLAKQHRKAAKSRQRIVDEIKHKAIATASASPVVALANKGG